MLVFDAGRAAFDRIWLRTPVAWSGRALQVGQRRYKPLVATGFAAMPGEVAGPVATLGGTGTAVSANSVHTEAAVALVRYQLHALMQSGDQVSSIASAAEPMTAIIVRPSAVAGSRYKQVSKAYIDAVHSVLSGQMQAAEAATQLEKQLVRITGFRPGPPTAGSAVTQLR